MVWEETNISRVTKKHSHESKKMTKQDFIKISPQGVCGWGSGWYRCQPLHTQHLPVSVYWGCLRYLQTIQVYCSVRVQVSNGDQSPQMGMSVCSHTVEGTSELATAAAQQGLCFSIWNGEWGTEAWYKWDKVSSVFIKKSVKMPPGRCSSLVSISLRSKYMLFRVSLFSTLSAILQSRTSLNNCAA